jgi:hypothetical protein
VIAKTRNEFVGAISRSDDHLSLTRDNWFIIDDDVDCVWIDLRFVFWV